MGKKYLLAFIAVCSIGIIFSPAGCKKKEPSRIPSPVSGEIQGDLHILHAGPKGQTQAKHESDEVVVIFDHPMAALEPLPLQEKTEYLKFDPPFGGKYRWMGTRTLVFTPKDHFPNATEISVAVPSGMSSLDGYVLKEDFRWSFSTFRPRLISHYPREKDKQQKLDTEVLLVFNQPVDEVMTKEFMAFIGVDIENQEHRIGFSVTHPPANTLEEAGIPHPPANILCLTPKEKLKPDFTYSVELKEGLPGKEGTLGLEKNVFFSFETFKLFKFEGLDLSGEQDPAEPLQFRFSNRVIYKDFIEKIRFEPPVEIPDYYAEWDHGNQVLWISLPLQPETRYAASIAADLKDEFGNPLGKEVRVEFATSAYKPSVRMTTGHGVLEAYGDLTYPLQVINATQVRLQAARLDKEDVIPVLTSEKVLWSSEFFIPKTGAYQVDKTLAFKPERNKRQLFPINVRDLVTEKYGFLFVQLDTFAEDKWDRYPKAFLQVTELGITGKFSPENNIIWVTELRTGEPVAGAEVEIRDGSNVPRWKGKTDLEGKAQTPGWKVLGMKSKDSWSKPEQWVFASRGNDVAFLSSEWGTGLDPYRFDIPYDWDPEPERIRGYIFTERGIYRAGEQVHIKGIIRKREKGQWQLVSVKEVDSEIQDPFQKTIYKGKKPLDAYGSFTIDLDTREDAPLGYYQVFARVPPESPGEKEFRVSETFRIEAFRPAEFEVHLRTLKESFIFSDSYEAEIRANYLFGGPMAGQKANWTLRLNPASYTPPGHKGYIFGSELVSWIEEDEMAERSRLIASGEGQLGPGGKISVNAQLLPEKESSTVHAALEATVQSPSRHSISNRIQVFVHQGEFYIGLKPSTSFLKKGETFQVLVITTNPGGSLVPDKKIAVKLIKREWRSVRKAGIGGRFQWISEKVDTEVASKDVRIKNEPVEVSFTPEKSGLYVLSASGQDGRKNSIRTTTYVYVTGKDYVPWERKDDDMLELIADSDTYKPGDRARILVKSPYERAKALVTIEREFILQTQVLEIQGSASEIEIPVTADFIPNAFVSVLLVQGRTSRPSDSVAEDVGKPSFKMGYVNLSVDPSEKRLSVDVASEKKSYKPRDSVTLRVKVQDLQNKAVPASVALAVVDIGVLNLIGYQTPDPFTQFYGERPLSVQTSETRLHVVGQRNYGEKGENVGGGGLKVAMAAPGLGEVELRGDFKSTAYWNPSVMVDEKGEATVQFTLPDNLTTFRIMAVAQTRDSRFGQSETDFRVTKPLLLLPSLPRFGRVGDRFQAGVVVNNFSSEKGTATLTLDADGIRLGGDKANSREIILAPGEGKEVLFSFEADTPGKAVFSFRAKMRDETDGLEITIPIELPRPTETVATFGEVAEEAKEEMVNIPETISPDQSRIEVMGAASALAGLSGSVEFLTNYPYVCLEQRLSSVLPYLVAGQVIQDFKLSVLEPKEIKKLVQEALREIYACQKESGGFGLWPDSAFESPFISCYAAFTLIKAKNAGYAIDPARLDSALLYLRSFLRLKPDAAFPYSPGGLKTTQAFALYDLALSGRPEPAFAEKLLLERENLSLFGRALLLKAFHLGTGMQAAKDTILEELVNKIKVTPSSAHFEEDDERGLAWIYTSNTRTTAVILQALLETGSDNPLLPAVAKWLVEKRRSGCWQSTQENFFVFYALNEFYRTHERVKPDFRAEISLARKSLLREMFLSVSQTAKASVYLTEFKTGAELPLKIEKAGTGTLYYGARLTYAPLQKLDPRDEGIAVYKKIESLDGKPLDSIKAGSLAVVTLQIVVPKESLFIVIDDPLPAGFEAVNASFLTESEEEQRKLEQMDEAEETHWWEGFNHMEMHDNRVLLFADSLRAGIHTHRYLARAVTFGDFAFPGTKAEEMYAPEVFGRSSEHSVKIVK